jgi:hypothetical protein
MLNERDDQYDGSDDSEYHFSDEEVGYETEADAAKPVVVEPEKNPLANLTQSKRMLISLGVFFVLVFVVYKMVAPSTKAPSTDITPAATQAPLSQAAPAAAAPSPQPSAAPVQTPALVPATNAMPAAPAAPTTMQASPDASSMPAAPAPASTEATPGVQQASMTAPPTMGNMVSQASAAAEQAPQQAAPVVNTTPVTNTPVMNSIDARAAQVSATNEQLMAQLQADYAQRLADYQAQNKSLQDEVKTLNTRVASMEAEMSQLVQTLTKAFQNNAPADGGSADVAATTDTGAAGAPAAADIKLPYSVQAIIPGRAWLRGDNGDTLTVTEGDTIKDVGQVSKIDPYNGIVEIKVGSKTVTLSYGNSG